MFAFFWTLLGLLGFPKKPPLGKEKEFVSFYLEGAILVRWNADGNVIGNSG